MDPAAIRLDRIRTQQRIHRDGAPCAGDAGADLLVALLLMVAEEDVAMIDLAIDGDKSMAHRPHSPRLQSYMTSWPLALRTSSIERSRGISSSTSEPFRRTRNVSVGSVPLEPKVS